MFRADLARWDLTAVAANQFLGVELVLFFLLIII
jgi:hypothetical protein